MKGYLFMRDLPCSTSAGTQNFASLHIPTNDHEGTVGTVSIDIGVANNV